MIVRRHACQPNTMGDLPVRLARFIVADANHVALAMLLPKLRRIRKHMLRIDDIVPWRTVTTRALSTIDMGAGLKNILAGAKRSGLHLAFDPGVQRQPHDMLLKRKRRVRDGHRQRSEANIQKQPRSHGCDTKEKPEKNLSKTAATGLFRHRRALLRKY